MCTLHKYLSHVHCYIYKLLSTAVRGMIDLLIILFLLAVTLIALACVGISNFVHFVRATLLFSGCDFYFE